MDLPQIKEYIGYRAFLHSRDAPEQKEDMEQTAWVAVIELLQKSPDAHISHVLVKAKCAILNYRKKGRSVDGKRDQSDRKTTYALLEVDNKPPGHRRKKREVEETALMAVLMDDLYSQLSPTARDVLNLRLNGVSWQNISGLLGGSVGDYRSPTRRHLEAVAVKVLGSKNRLKPAGARSQAKSNAIGDD